MQHHLNEMDKDRYYGDLYSFDVEIEEIDVSYDERLVAILCWQIARKLSANWRGRVVLTIVEGKVLAYAYYTDDYYELDRDGDIEKELEGELTLFRKYNS